MIERIAKKRMLNALEKGKVVTIVGPRQVGKSTLAGELIAPGAKILELDGDNSDVQTMFEDVNESKLKLLLANKDYLLVDEAQKIANVGNMLKILADKHRELKVIVTGSSAFKLTRAVNESLAGRKREFKLFPLSFKEMVEHTSLLEENRMLEHRVIYGYYPEVVSNPGDEKEVLRELVDSYLYKDVMEENQIAKPARLVKLVQALAFQTGSLISANELGKLVGLDTKTVERYIDILQKSYIIYTLPSYAKNQRNELKFSRKVYFWDMGIRNAVISNMAPKDLRSSEEWGHMWENFLITERIKRNNDSGRTFVEHYFWRTQQKNEVDLIEIEDGKMLGVEIKKKDKKIVAPKSFAGSYPQASFTVISPDNIDGFLL